MSMNSPFCRLRSVVPSRPTSIHQSSNPSKFTLEKPGLETGGATLHAQKRRTTRKNVKAKIIPCDPSAKCRCAALFSDCSAWTC